ncbi:MAG TPA: tripartite tricarboxylate transporter substrate binding protein [Burkholderiales bacterium]|nr:tripartite tricarboxylate transporter substrate binding protein [Burkholderiales bacterium]
MRVFILLAVATGAMASTTVVAQSFPNKPVRFVVASGPGGSTDGVSRIIGDKLSEVWGQQLVHDNRPGAGGILAAEIVARAVPDGYTVLVGTSAGLSVSPSIYKKMPYDPDKAFAPISLAGTQDYMLIANPAAASSMGSVKELIAAAKAKPGFISFSHTGSGTGTHLAAELFKSAAGVDLLSVPYKNITAAMIAVMSGEVPISFVSIYTALPQVRSGKAKALAVTGEKRSPAAPELPTVSESGLPGYESRNWYGFLATAGTPRTVIDKLNADILKALSHKEVRERMTRQGMEPGGSTPDEFAKFIRSETAKYARVIKAAGIRGE